jgi:hypothetical protein
MPCHLGVAEMETVPGPAHLRIRQLEDLSERQRLSVRTRQQVLGRELMLLEVPLELELGDPHPAASKGCTERSPRASNAGP